MAQRTLYAADTYNATTGEYQFPQTPSRIMLSLWPAGSSTNGKGTIDWAGGLIDWDSGYMVNGYYYAQIMNVDVECYSPASSANVTGSKSYVYNSDTGLNSSVAVTDDNTILASFYATGENQSFDPNASSSSSSSASTTATQTASASGSSTSTVAMATESVQTVPGSSAGGLRTDGSTGSSGSSGSSSSSSSSGLNGGFSQGLAETTNKAAAGPTEEAVRGSAFAVLVAFVLLTLM